MNEIWDSIYEQNNAKNILKSIIDSRRVPHAFLFYGPDGVGKFNTALQFAKLLYLSLAKDNTESDLKKISLLQEPYVKLVFPLPRGKGESGDDSSTDKLSKEQMESMQEQIALKINNPYHSITIENANNIKINSIRDIKKFLDLSYDEIPFRFIFIIDAHLMNDQAQNALLKSLEEPPAGIIFFLLTSSRERLLPTIHSRAWPLNFEPLALHSLEDILTKYFDIEEKTAEKAVLFANGSVTRALYLAQKDFDSLLNSIISFLRFAIGKKYHSAFKELSLILNDQNEEEYKLALNLIKDWLNDVLRERHSINEFHYENFKDTFIKFNQRYGKSNIVELVSKLELLEEYYSKNLNLNVLILNIIFELATLSSRK